MTKAFHEKTLQPDKGLVQEMFTALKQCDQANLQILLSPSAVLHVPGHNSNAGDYYGPQGFLEFWSKMSQRAAGKVDLRILEVLAGVSSAAVIALSSVERKGERLENRVVYVLRLEEGRIGECWIHNYDQNTVDAFWS
jgi:ketosteroid isomerase-like protein